MFDIGFFELCIIGIVALLVLGPERLPRAARTAGMWLGRAKRMVSQVKRDIDDELRQEELLELREAKESLSKTRESINSFKEDLNQQVDTDDGEGKKASSSKAPASKGSSSKGSGSKGSDSKGSGSKETSSKEPAAGESTAGTPASREAGAEAPADSGPNAAKTE